MISATAPALTDIELAGEFGAAHAALASVRLSDPRRETDAYRAAELAVEVLAAELARRETLAVAEAEAITAAAVCNDASCGAATSHRELCECRCDGEGHGREHRARREEIRRANAERTARAGGVMAQLAAQGGLGDSDDGWWNETPAGPARKVVLPDFDDPCWD